MTFLVLVFLWRRRKALARAPRRWRRRGSGLLLREEDIVAGLTQSRSAGPEAGLDAPRIEQIGAAQPHRVRGAGLTLFGRSLIALSESGNWDHEEKCRCSQPAANSTRRHYHSCSVAGIPDRGSGDKSASINWRFQSDGNRKGWTVASKLGCNRPDRSRQRDDVISPVGSRRPSSAGKPDRPALPPVPCSNPTVPWILPAS